ncbi:siderophore-interacting protein [Stutzerimonas tarimensis]|uniref:Siderophore-interacting protein n=1 Tax=Stutzerimonas tarimensis TaxID=1507735 RepID=A0ABV7T433_9GAMM
MQVSNPMRRVQRVRHELHRREVTVSRVAPLGDSFVAVTFTGETLDGFLSASFDDHVKFMFEDATGETIRRDYTPRHFDPARRELTIEFALHGDGQASTWAQRAAVGQPAVIAGPRGSMIIPADYDWHLLIGDATALPAITRRLEELSAGTRAIVLALQEGAADRRDLHSRSELQVQWLENPDALVEAVRSLELPSGEGFAWGAGEASIMARVRAVLADEKGHPKEAMRVAAYWRLGVADHHEDLTA